MTALSNDDVQKALSGLAGWSHDNDMITKTYEFDNYLDGVAFAGAVGTIAQGHGHHPDMMITWRKVQVSFTTHDEGSKVTEKDINAAKAIEALGFPA